MQGDVLPKREHKDHRPSYLIFAILSGITLLVVIWFFPVSRFASTNNSPEITPQPTSAPTEAQSSSDQATATPQPQDTEVPNYSTLFEWIQQRNPINVEIYTLKTEGGVDKREKIIPVLGNLYIIKLDKDNLKYNTLMKKLRIEITINEVDDEVDDEVKNMGCLEVRFGKDKHRNCEFSQEKPITANFSFDALFAIQQNNATSNCPDLGSPYYTDAKSFIISLDWVVDDSSIDLKRLWAAEMDSNLVMLSKDTEIGEQNALSCEAVLITSDPPMNGDGPLVYSFRTEKEGNVPIDSLQLSPKYLEWLQSK